MKRTWVERIAATVTRFRSSWVALNPFYTLSVCNGQPLQFLCSTRTSVHRMLGVCERRHHSRPYQHVPQFGCKQAAAGLLFPWLVSRRGLVGSRMRRCERSPTWYVSCTQLRRLVEFTLQSPVLQIDSFERKQGLHGPGYMTRKELRVKLRGTEEYNLGVDIKRASKEELVAAYNLFRQMLKDGKIDKAEHKRKQAEALERSLGLASLSTATQERHGDMQITRGSSGDAELPVNEAARPAASRSTSQLRFNTRREDTGPVKRLTPRSGSKLVKYFDE